MFWKKKTTDYPDLIVEPENKRDAFRYVFVPHDRISIEFKNRNIDLINISATGLAFKNEGFKVNDSDLIELELDIPNYLGNTTLSFRIRIISTDKKDICHCLFEDCTDAQQEIIHKYLLEKQKQDLRKKKK